ncbi:uncharacterized protein simc1 isoform X1 [Xyrichtys novacula]|uniref:Uncharacterized protein simc1 isoform X1 n=1 Tax=Xyrichtys novacula TaxID=13765 RepID=A0AAV1FC53_XYRNO|nr:uncharacterized protein simc1 isoform X1 [Xyrichtys novacula]
MGDVIVLSSGSDEEDSDVQIVGSYSHFMTTADPLPLSQVRVDVDALNVNVPMQYINLTDPKWTLPELKRHKRKSLTVSAVVDLTMNEKEKVKEQEIVDLPSGNNQVKEESKDGNVLDKKDWELKKRSSSGLTAQEQDSSNFKQEHTSHKNGFVPTVQLKRLSFLGNHATEMKMSSGSVFLDKDCRQTSLKISQQGIVGETSQCDSNPTTTTSNGFHTKSKVDESPFQITESPVRQEQQIFQLLDSTVADSRKNSTLKDARDGSCPEVLPASPLSPFSSDDKAHNSSQRAFLCYNLELRSPNEEDNAQSCLSDHASLHFSAIRLNPPEHNDLNSQPQTSPKSQNHMSQVYPEPSSEHATAEDSSKWQTKESKAAEASNSSDLPSWSIPSEPLLSVPKTEDMDSKSSRDLEIDSPLSFLWQEGIEEEEEHTKSRFDMEFRAASIEDRHFVSPVTVRKMMSRVGPARAMTDEQEGIGSPEVLCRKSLSQVYSTMDVNYPEGTLQLLSDLLKPGYYPPRNVTSHLLHGILLDPQCPYHLCVEAFNLLMRTQRHHMADKTNIPWDWESLSTLMANQDHTKKHRTEVVRMFLEYVVQTLEDDFQVKYSSSSLQHSIAKATLSCDQQFPRVREVIKWLISVIVKSAEHEQRRELARERDEHIRMVSILQRMLSLALEIDRSPALTSAKLSQELFHMLIGNMPIRTHRMLLLESLQSKLLRCKLLVHLLDYACPLKNSPPMSLSLLLHFLHHCTLAPDPTDGTERWKKWEELIHLLWMFLLSYNKAMTGYLCSSVGEQRDRVGSLVYKPDDVVSKAAVREAVEAFLTRSKADLGQALPLHVEESLTYLQDYLLDVCQC